MSKRHSIGTKPKRLTWVLSFLQELRATYRRILVEPFGYQELRLAYVGRSRGDFPMRCTFQSKARPLLWLRFFTRHAIRRNGNGEFSSLAKVYSSIDVRSERCSELCRSEAALIQPTRSQPTGATE